MARLTIGELKEDLTVARCPFTIVVDTREQAGWHFTGITDDATGRPLIVPLITDQALPTGDYSIAGLEGLVTIERKSVGDFAASITHERDRFEREMERMRDMVRAGGFAAVVIEGDWRELLVKYPERSRVSGKCISRTIASWSIRYGVHFYPTMDRRHAELWTFRLLQMFARQKEHEKAVASANGETRTGKPRQAGVLF